MLPSITDVSEDCRQRNDLRLVGEVENTIDVQHVQKLRRLHKAAFHPDFVSFVFFEGEIQQCLPVACNGGQFLALFASGLGDTPSITGMKKRNRLKEIRISNTGDDPRVLTCWPESLDKTSMPSRLRVLTIPVFPQLVADCGIHRGNQIKRVQRFASCVDLLEDDANSFLGS
jgi:hypothetical protein